MSKITFDANNQGIISLEQIKHDGKVVLTTAFPKEGKMVVDEFCSKEISNGDFVMLLNYYTYVKKNNIRNSFINPCGTNTDER
ncbi:hypothetical protein [Enterocloster bolteae]|uniref:hypothetical protein n=1 Tax=Enterocloster bolteae TaxID=208479 RepID=UPI0034A33EBB